MRIIKFKFGFLKEHKFLVENLKKTHLLQI